MAAMRMLAYGTIIDLWDEYLWMCESTCLEAIFRFATALVKVFGLEYLREPHTEDTTRPMALGESRGYPGFLS